MKATNFKVKIKTNPRKDYNSKLNQCVKALLDDLSGKQI